MAERLKEVVREPQNTVVYAMPRGGVVLGYEIAKALKCPLSLVITRKIGHPHSPEYAIGVVTEEGETIFNEEEIKLVDQTWLKEELKNQREEAKRRRDVYLGGKKPISAEGKTAIIVDDGVATGLSLFLAVKKIKKEKPKRLIVAIPVAPKDTALRLKKEVNELVAMLIDENYLGAVGAYYQEFNQVEDREVIDLLSR